MKKTDDVQSDIINSLTMQLNLLARCDILSKKNQKLFYGVWSELQDNQT